MQYSLSIAATTSRLKPTSSMPSSDAGAQQTPAFHERPTPSPAAVTNPSAAAFSGKPVTAWITSPSARTPWKTSTSGTGSPPSADSGTVKRKLRSRPPDEIATSRVPATPDLPAQAALPPPSEQPAAAMASVRTATHRQARGTTARLLMPPPRRAGSAGPAPTRAAARTP